MAYTIKQARPVLLSYLGLKETTASYIAGTDNWGILYQNNGLDCVIFMMPLGENTSSPKVYFDVRDSGAEKFIAAWEYAESHNLKFFCLGVKDVNATYKDSVISIEADIKTVLKISGLENGRRSGSGTQLNIPKSLVPNGNVNRKKSDRFNIFYAVINKNFILSYLESFDNRLFQFIADPTHLDDDTEPTDNVGMSRNRIVFGAPGTGKTFIINKEAEKYFGTIADVASKDVWQNIAESIQNSDKTVASLFAIGIKYAIALKDENPKSLVQKFKVTYDGAYAINQGIRVIDFFTKLPEYDAEKIESIIKEQLEKLKNEQFLMQAGSAAIGLKYSEFFYGKSSGDIINELNLSKTSSQASWIWNGAQSAKYFEDEEEEKEVHRCERVTFHPNYSYAQFVGTYKPVQDKNDKTTIRYEYIPGPFMRVYAHAMQAKQAGSNDEFLLIIEEINRANVAAVFGDVFQLLDRKNGESEYPVAASEDIKNYLRTCRIDDCEELKIPDNMYIWATMNSADQGVFPMDTAFKRRWEFEYIGINDNQEGIEKYEIPLEIKKDADGNIIGHEWKNWNDLRHSINDKLTEMKINEDKLLGPYFISEEKLKLVDGRNEDKANEFVKSFKSKVLMYLFEDAVKMRPGDLFNENVIGRLRFSDICKKFDEIGQGIFNFKK